MANNHIPEVAAARLSLIADASSIAPVAGKAFKGIDKFAAQAGTRWGKIMTKRFDETKPDMDKLADDVTKAEKKITEETRRSANAQAMAKAKVEAAQASLNEKIEKYGKDTAQAKRANIQLMQAQGNLEKETLRAADAMDKLNSQLHDAKDAYKAGDEAADKYAAGWRGLGSKLTARVATGIAASGAVGQVVARREGSAAGNAYASAFGAAMARMSGARVLMDLGESFGKKLANLDKSAPKIALVSSAVLTLSGTMLAGLANTAGFVGALGTIAPAALVLPGFIGAGAAAMGVFTMAMMDAATVLEDLGPGFVALQDAVSAKFWDQAAQPIRDLVNTWLPTLSTKMQETATVMGSFTADAARALSTELSLGQMSAMFDYLNESIDRARAGVAPMTEAIMTLGLAGTSYLPRLGDYVAELSIKFNDFIMSAASDGRLHMWIENGIQGLKDLGNSMLSLGGIFKGIGDAMEAGGFVVTLGGFAAGMERINQAVNGPMGQGFLTNIFTGAKASLDGVMPGLSAFGDAIVNLGPTIETLMGTGGKVFGTFLTGISDILNQPVFQQGLTTFMTGALTGIQALMPAMGPLGELFGVVATTAGQVAETLGGTLGTVLALLAPVVADLLLAIQPMIPLLGELFVSAVTSLAPLIADLGMIITTQIIPAFINVLGWIQENETWFWKVVAVAAAVIGALVALAPVIAFLVSPLGWVVAAVGLLVVSIIGMVATWQFIWNKVKSILANITAWIINTALPWIANKIAWLMSKFTNFKLGVSAVWESVKAKIASVYSWFAFTLVTSIRARIQDLINKFFEMRNRVSGIWNGLKSLLSIGWNYIRDNVFNKLKAAVQSGLPAAFDRAKKAIKDIWNDIKNVVRDPLRIVLRDILQAGLINKVNGILNSVDKKKKIPRIPNVWPMAGFRKGGYTGNYGKDEVAGVVHGREHVTRAESTASIERKAPGFLDRLNKYGASALPSFGHEGHAAHGGMAAGGPGGPGTYLWGGLQNRIYQTGIAHVTGGAPGYDIGAAARAWNNMSNIKVKHGRGQNQITVGSGAPAGTWGYAWSDGRIQLNPGIPGNMKTGTAAHEIGHVLGLDHAGTNSIMHPMMRGPLWPSAYDRATMRRIYGGAGNGTPPEGGGGWLSDITSWLSDKISPVTKFASNLGNTFSSKLPDGGLFPDMAKASIERVTGGITDWLKSKVKGFFGNDDGGAGARGRLNTNLYDGGGWLGETGKPLLVEHKRNKPDAVLTNDQWTDMHHIAENSDSARGDINFHLNPIPYEDPEKAARHLMDQAAFRLQGV